MLEAQADAAIQAAESALCADHGAEMEELVKLEHYVEKNCAGAKLEPGWSVSRFRRKNGTYEGRWDLYL